MRSSGEPVFITQRGRPTAVLMSVDTYERSANEREVLRILARGEREIASGIGYDLEDVLAEADRLLADD
jgi:PHD/YefM family antitoxin component YafN of YafNO toxin-antitoxin module